MTETTHVPAPVTARRYTESISLFVDPLTRAYTLGRAVDLAGDLTNPRESEVLRAMLDAEIDRHRESSPATYARLVEIGKAEIERRAAAKQQ